MVSLVRSRIDSSRQNRLLLEALRDSLCSESWQYPTRLIIIITIYYGSKLFMVKTSLSVILLSILSFTKQFTKIKRHGRSTVFFNQRKCKWVYFDLCITIIFSLLIYSYIYKWFACLVYIYCNYLTLTKELWYGNPTAHTTIEPCTCTCDGNNQPTYISFKIQNSNILKVQIIIKTLVLHMGSTYILPYGSNW